MVTFSVVTPSTDHPLSDRLYNYIRVKVITLGLFYKN